MKTIKKQIKPIALLFGLLILLQSCVVYKQTSLEKAVKLEKKVIIITKTDEILKFQRIEFEDENFYGIKKVKGETVKIQLDSLGIKKVSLPDKTLSTVLWIGIPLGIVLAVSPLVYGGGGI